MSVIPQPSLGGKKLPVSIDLAAISWGQHLAKRLVRFKDLGSSPSRDAIIGTAAGVPITNIDYWEGRWVLCPLRIELKSGEGLTFSDAVASASREHRIVSTALTGRDGTVKEYINAGDWVVNIVVGLQKVNGHGEIEDEWPGDELRTLRKLMESNESLRVHSEFLDALNVDRIVVRSYQVEQMTESNYQIVMINSLSDKDYEIFSKEY